MTGLALPWLILLQTHSAFAAGVVAAARYVPVLALALVAGLVADRVERRALALTCDVGRALALGAVAVLGLLGQAPPLWLLTVVVLALGTGSLFFGVAFRAWLPDVTGDDRLGQANAALEASDAASVLVGTPLGGALITASGPVLALGADALSYVASALTLARIPSAGRPVRQPMDDGVGPERRLRGVWLEAIAGVRAILDTPAQRLLKGAGTALYLDAGAIEVLLAALTQLRLHLPAWQAGLVFGAAGIGGLLSSAVASRVYKWGWRPGLACALGVAALGSAGLAWASVLDPARGFIVALASNLVLDGAVALGFILSGTASTLVTPRDLRGRVSAASAIYEALARGVAAIGFGALAATGNPFPAFVVLAGCCACAALVTARAHVEAAQE
ncbi:MAG: MFS transporter [Chloroflexota bacterium]|nr:MFS transporter [Chloroflexota bacterium]